MDAVPYPCLIRSASGGTVAQPWETRHITAIVPGKTLTLPQHNLTASLAFPWTPYSDILVASWEVFNRVQNTPVSPRFITVANRDPNRESGTGA